MVLGYLYINMLMYIEKFNFFPDLNTLISPKFGVRKMNPRRDSRSQRKAGVRMGKVALPNISNGGKFKLSS